MSVWIFMTRTRNHTLPGCREHDKHHERFDWSYERLVADVR